VKGSWRIVLGALLCIGVSAVSVQNRAPAGGEGASTSGRVVYVPGSTKKVCQLTGETDREFNRPTVNRTETLWGLKSADGGYSFEHQGKLVFVFGDAEPHCCYTISTWEPYQKIIMKSTIRIDSSGGKGGDGGPTAFQVHPFSTTATLDLARVAPPIVQPHRFSTTLPPMSVTTFVGALGEGNGFAEAQWRALEDEFAIRNQPGFFRNLPGDANPGAIWAHSQGITAALDLGKLSGNYATARVMLSAAKCISIWRRFRSLPATNAGQPVSVLTGTDQQWTVMRHDETSCDGLSFDHLNGVAATVQSDSDAHERRVPVALTMRPGLHKKSRYIPSDN
jgi:hypothetical protein